MRILVALLVGLFFVACGNKSIEVSQNSSSQTIQEKKQTIEDDNNNYIEQNFQGADEDEAVIFGTEQTTEGADLLPIYFAFDSYVISKEMFAIVDKNAQILKRNPKEKIVLQGNTDAYGSDEYNFALGIKRSLSVKDALIVRGIHRDRISNVSFGETNPICTELSEECRQKNRRVDFAITND